MQRLRMAPKPHDTDIGLMMIGFRIKGSCTVVFFVT